MTVYVRDKLVYTALSARLKYKNCRIIRNLNQNADIAIAAEKQLKLQNDVGILLVNSERLPNVCGTGKVKTVVSCGMGEKDTVNFSAISGDRASLCLQRNIKCKEIELESGEFPVVYDENLSVYHNIAISLCQIMLQYTDE